MKKWQSTMLMTVLILSLSAVSCGQSATQAPAESATMGETEAEAETPAGSAEEAAPDAAYPAGDPEEVAAVILHTNDVHVGLQDYIGYDGLALYKKELEALYDSVLLIVGTVMNTI